MSYRRRDTTDARLAATLSKTPRLAAVSSIRLVRHFSIVLQAVEFPDTRAHRVVANETSAFLKSR